ncbi:MAG: hypothetical protein KAU03_03925 [Candidatus Altiarchaeales archaeon]|nr:hypothetical protein [Candidatus Altiarchaeales archaeon]
MKTKIGNKGQMAWFDMIIILLCITFFTAGVWAFTLGGKTAGTQAQRSKQDFTHSLLIGTLYTTLDADNPRLRGKSISDVLGMYFTTQQDKVTKEFIKEQLKEIMIHKYLEDKGSVEGGDIEWFLCEEDKEICFHGVVDTIEECEDETVNVISTTSASVEIIYPKEGGSDRRIIYLIIKWK